MHPAVNNGPYDVGPIREDFPALAMQVYGKPLVYLDRAAAAQRPKAVLYRFQKAYTEQYANVQRAACIIPPASLRGRARERARFPRCTAQVRDHRHPQRQRGNQPRRLSFSRERTEAGDEIVLSIMEHHSNKG
jgi:cysteine desulfurase/selenocysteine lyase